MTQRIKYSTLGFLFGSILFVGSAAFAANGSWSIGNGFMVFQQQGSSSEVNVGIGLDNPDEKLVVNGKIKSASTDIAETDGQVVTTVDYVLNKIDNSIELKSLWQESGNNVFRKTGNVGIQVENPTDALEVGGSIRALNSIKLGESGENKIIGEVKQTSAGIFVQSATGKKASLVNSEGKGLTVNNNGDGTFSEDISVDGDFSFEKILWNPSKNINLVNTGEYSFDFSENTGASNFNIWAPSIGSIFSVKSNGEVSIEGKNVATEDFVTGKNYLTSYTETDPQVGANTTNYIPKWNGSALVKGTIVDNGNIGIGKSPAADRALDVNGDIYMNDKKVATEEYLESEIARLEALIKSAGVGRIIAGCGNGDSVAGPCYGGAIAPESEFKSGTCPANSRKKTNDGRYDWNGFECIST